jgi:hypothetical protein
MAWSPDYVAMAELADFVRIIDGLDDIQLGYAITAASRAVDATTGRQFGQVDTAEARFYTAHYDQARSRWRVPVDDLMSASGLVVAVDVDGDGTYPDVVVSPLLRPANAAQTGWPWTEVVVPVSSAVQPTATEAAVSVTAGWGWSSVPVAVAEATLLQASRLLARRDSPFGIAGSPDAGSEMRLLARVDPDVAVTLEPYKRRDRRVVFA